MAQQSEYLRHPVHHSLLYDFYAVFLKGQSIAQNVQSGSIRLEGALLLSKRYRLAIKKAIKLLEKPENNEDQTSADVQQFGEELCSAELLWSLIEAVSIRSSHNLIAIDLLEWSRECFPFTNVQVPSGQEDRLGDCTFLGSVMEELMQKERPEMHDTYWNSVIRQALCADFPTMATLLQFHSSFKTDEALVKMVKMLQTANNNLFKHDRSNCDGFLATQKKIRDLVANKQFFRLHDNLGVICSLMIGDKGTFKKYFHLFRPNWFEVFPAYLLYFYPTATEEQMQKVVESMFNLLGLSRRQLSRIEQVVLAILELDMMNALRLICTSGHSKSWFAVHLVDLLHFHDPAFLNPTSSTSSGISIPKNPKVFIPKEHPNIHIDLELRSRLLIEYSESLFQNNQLWEIAPDYLMASGVPNAVEMLDRLIAQLDWHGNTGKAERLLTICDRFDLQMAREDILRAVTMKFCRQGEWSSALNWALRMHNNELSAQVARRILQGAIPASRIGQMRIFESLSDQFVNCAELVLLYKFYTFKRQLLDGELRLALQLLHELFLDNSSPTEFHVVLSEEMVRILSTFQRPMVGVDAFFEMNNIPGLDRDSVQDMFRALSTFQMQQNLLKTAASEEKEQQKNPFSDNTLFPSFLDVIANRCLASGTNARTDQDHTAYTLATAGSNGFLKVLPVYLDHLLTPMLTDDQYVTEVHHIDGEGQDSGVVYSEMQDCESDMETLVDRKRKELFYPKNSGYAVHTGGRLPDLRDSCSPEKVRQYHKNFYHLNNLFVTVSGMIDHDKLLRAIEQVEERNLGNIPSNFPRPFQTRLPSEIHPKTAKILCPSDDESSGSVEISWRGPHARELYTIRALMILSDYLTDSAGAPLRRDFVQVADPFCSSVHISLMEQTDCELIASFSDVPTKKLEEIQNRFFEKTVADHAEANAFDMERLGFILDQQTRNFLSQLENNPHSLIKDAVVGHQLYGTEMEEGYKELDERLNEVAVLKKLNGEPASFWHRLFHEYFTRNCVCVLGEPSKKEVDEVMNKEAKRIAEQIKKLGPEGLTEKKRRLEEAIKNNTSAKPSDEILSELIVKELENFHLIPVETNEIAVVKSGNNHILPSHVFVHKVPSDFIEVNLLFDTHAISSEDRHYLLLWCELMFQSPAVVDGQELGYEDVSKLATRDLVSNAISVGVAGVYDRFISLKLRVDAQNYPNLAKWAEIFLTKTRFQADRAMICAKKLANKAAESKRDANAMSHFLNTTATYATDSNTFQFNYVALEKFNRDVAKKLEKGGSTAEKILQRLEDVRSRVLASQMNIHFAGDKIPLKNDANWQFLQNNAPNEPLECLPEYGQKWENLGKVQAIAVGGSESAFLLQKTQFDDDWNGPTTMQTLLLTQYLCQCEGPLWNAIRGTGLAYDASIYLLPDRKVLTMNLYRCSQLAQTYEKTRETVFSIIDAGKLDEVGFEAAKRSLICELVGGQGTVKSTATSAMLATLRHVGLDFTRQLCSRVWHATSEDVLSKGAPAIKKLFDPSKSVCSIALNPSRMPELKAKFPGVEVVKLEKFQIPPKN